MAATLPPNAPGVCRTSNTSVPASRRVLVVDDQPDVLEALRLLLKGHGYTADTVNSPDAALALLDRHDYDAVLLDMNYARDTTSAVEGLDLLLELRARTPMTPVIVMTAWGSVTTAVEAMRRGARDYVEKPWDNARLITILDTQVELGRTLRRADQLESANKLLRHDDHVRLIAESPAMRAVVRLMERVGPSDANVLVTGEHGTGKELVARHLHDSSPRSSKPFIAVDVGSLPEALSESELFGHVKGAFTDARNDRLGRFELADGGTLFLDEIGNAPLALQAKLLRALQSGDIVRVGSARVRHVDVRVISATNTPLRDAVAAQRFREDLLFRLNTIEIHVPPLRVRREDIPLLASSFLARHSSRYRNQPMGFDTGVIELLLNHSWPGNVREFDHAIERAVLLAHGDCVRAQDFALRADLPAARRIEDLTLEEVERLLIERALNQHHGNVGKAALALGLSRSAMYRRITAHGLLLA